MLLLVGVIAAVLALFAMRHLTKPSETPPDSVYTLRGIIDTLPQIQGPDKYIKIHHEALPSFKNKKGEVVGMPEMIMDFEQIAPGVSMGDLKAGDPIEFTFEVRWEPRTVTRIVKIVQLPKNVELPLKRTVDSK